MHNAGWLRIVSFVFCGCRRARVVLVSALVLGSLAHGIAACFYIIEDVVKDSQLTVEALLPCVTLCVVGGSGVRSSLVCACLALLRAENVCVHLSTCISRCHHQLPLLTYLTRASQPVPSDASQARLA